YSPRDREHIRRRKFTCLPDLHLEVRSNALREITDLSEKSRGGHCHIVERALLKKHALEDPAGGKPKNGRLNCPVPRSGKCQATAISVPSARQLMPCIYFKVKRPHLVSLALLFL